MNGIPPAPAADVVYPDSDGLPMAETGVHILVIVHLIATLRQLFRARPDVYVIGDMFLYYEEGHPESRRTPDVMVVKGVEAGPERRSFKLWVEGVTPAVVFEITSKETAEEDREAKRELYERLGVREYFLFDPLHEYLEQPLIGYRLIHRVYEPLIPATDGGLLSAELGLRLVPEGTSLALFSFRTGERIPTPPEAYRLLEEAQRRADAEQRRADQARRSAEEERRRADQQQQRAEEERQRAAQERLRAAEERQRAEEERQRAAQERQRAEEERQRAAEERQRAEQAEQRAAELERELERLRSLQPPAGPSA